MNVSQFRQINCTFFGDSCNREQFIFLVTDIISAALAGLYITFISQQVVSMLHCDYACSSLCGKKSLRGKFAPVGAETSCDIFAELVVELEIGGLLENGIDFVLGHGCTPWR